VRGALAVVPVILTIPLERNPRTHSDQHIGEIAASMREFGFLWPIMVNGETRRIVAGNGRRTAAPVPPLPPFPAEPVSPRGACGPQRDGPATGPACRRALVMLQTSLVHQLGRRTRFATLGGFAESSEPRGWPKND